MQYYTICVKIMLLEADLLNNVFWSDAVASEGRHDPQKQYCRYLKPVALFCRRVAYGQQHLPCRNPLPA